MLGSIKYSDLIPTQVCPPSVANMASTIPATPNAGFIAKDRVVLTTATEGLLYTGESTQVPQGAAGVVQYTYWSSRVSFVSVDARYTH